MTLMQGLDGIDLLADTWGRGVPHDQFDRLRREAPVYWHPEPDDPGFWAVTKHADVRAVSHDCETFSSELGGTFIPTAGRGGAGAACASRSSTWTRPSTTGTGGSCRRASRRG